MRLSHNKSLQVGDIIFPVCFDFAISSIPGDAPNLHFPHLHRTQIYTNPDLHGTHIYTAQIYTNPFPHIDSKKPKFTQPKFTQNPNLHNPTLHITQIYTKPFLQILLKLYKVNSIIKLEK